MKLAKVTDFLAAYGLRLVCIGVAFTTYYQVRDDIFLGKYWENERDQLLVASYIAGFATTFLVVIGKFSHTRQDSR